MRPEPHDQDASPCGRAERPAGRSAHSPGRRLLLACGLGLPVAAGLPACVPSRPRASYVVAARAADGRHVLVLHGARHEELARVALGARAHGFAQDPGRPARLVVFARRPGTRAWVLDLDERRLVAEFASAAGRHFYGHGAFTPDGAHLLTTENDYEAGRGVIVVRSTDDWRVVGEMPAHGVGPHELRLMPGGRHLAVAVGGIRTHPSRPREKLDLDAMRPALNYVEIASGRLLGSYAPPDHHQGIRHLDVAADGTVVVAIQHEGIAGEGPGGALLARHRGEDALVFPEASPGDWAALQGYVGSIRIAAEGRHAIASSPRGNVLVFWDWRENRLEASQPMLDACAVAIDARGEVASATGGAGETRIYARDATGWRLARIAPAGEPLAFDNHMAAVG
jgi:hypothetical protein